MFYKGWLLFTKLFGCVQFTTLYPNSKLSLCDTLFDEHPNKQFSFEKKKKKLTAVVFQLWRQNKNKIILKLN